MSYRQQGYTPQASRSVSQKRTTAASGARAPQTRSASSRQPARGNTRRKKRRGSPFKVFLLLVMFALLATGCVMGYMVYDEIGRVERMNTFYPGVYIDGQQLYGSTPQQAYEHLLKNAQKELEGWAIELKYSGQTWAITTETLGISQALSQIVANEVNTAFQIGRETGSILDRYQTILKLKTQPYEAYTTGAQSNTAPIDSILEDIRGKVAVAPVDATLGFDPNRNNPIVTTAEVVGRELDVAALKAQIVQMVNNMEAGSIDIQTKAVQPNATVAQLTSQFARLSSFTTNIRSSSTADRNANIEIGCSRFHGKKVAAGAKVSFNEVVGKRTEANGFHQALEIVNGEYVEGWGGGICQASSTLYNAVIQAGLKVTERSPHGIPVGYLDLGADATVADDRRDFVFVNDTGADIYFIARSNGKTCTFEIYGRPDPNGYSYKLRHETIEEIPIPEKPTKKNDTEAKYVVYTDQTKIEKGAVGYKVRTYLVTTDANGNFVSEKELYVDTYKPISNKEYVGVTPRQ